MARLICPRCLKRVSPDPDKHMMLRDETLHRSCAMEETGEMAEILALYDRQDDTDPETRMADLIAQLGHACDYLNKGLRGRNRIDFENALGRGLRSWEPERG